MTTPEGKDPVLWELAHKRAAFKRHLAMYLVINLFLWMLWFLSSDRTYRSGGVPWPVWSTLGWGVGLAFHYFGAYVTDSKSTIEKEYSKLQKQKNT